MVHIGDQEGTALEFLQLRPHGGRSGVFTTVAIPKDAIIVRMRGDLLRSPDRYSFQIDVNMHLGRGGLIDDELNHSCNANARIEFSDLTLRASRDIASGEEICINYCSTEEVLAEPFVCDCGSESCYGEVKGFRFLTLYQQNSLKNMISPYLRSHYGRLFEP